MNPLNPFLYLKNNVKSGLPMFISILIGVFLIYFFSLFSATTIKMYRITRLDLMDKYNIAYTKNGTTLPLPFLAELENSADNGAIPVRVNPFGLAYYRGGLGSTTMLTFNVFEEDAGILLDSFGIELAEGALPHNNQHEILVPREYALQNNLSVGDYIGGEVSDEYSFPGKYKICGLMQGEVMFTLACQPGNETKDQIMSRGVMYRMDHLSSEEQMRLINRLPEHVVTLTHESFNQEFALTLTSMELLTYILTAVMIIIFSIALGSLNSILFAKRRSEFMILHSIGYTKGELSRKLWVENLYLCLSGYLVGICFSEIVAYLINIISFQPRGKTLELISWQGLLSAFALPVFISIFSLLPSLLNGFRNIKEFNS